MSTGLAVLLTNLSLERRGGTETVIRDVALGLLRRGHRPIVYAPRLGEPAEEIRSRGVAVISDLAQLAEAPDVIHGQHYVQTAEAIIRFPETPALQVCHAWEFWEEAPAKFPQVHRYIAVDEAVRDRLVHMEGIAPEQVEIVPNAVDLRRMPARPEPLPKRPLRALAFTKFSGQLPMIEAACRHHGIQLDVLGSGGNKVVAHPERELVRYDIVFATARMALEAICAGCAVILCDSRGTGGMVTSAELPRLRALNFGLRSLVTAVSAGRLAREIERYDPRDAERVSGRMRELAAFEPVLDHLEMRYREAMARPAASAAEHRAAMLRFLHDALPRKRPDARWPWTAEREQMQARIAQLERALAARPAGEIEPLPQATPG